MRYAVSKSRSPARLTGMHARNPPFANPGGKAEVEEGALLMPRFGADGLITCVTTDADAGDVLMVAHMNADALARTMETGEAWYWSRSRRRTLAQRRDERPASNRLSKCGSTAIRTPFGCKVQRRRQTAAAATPDAARASIGLFRSARGSASWVSRATSDLPPLQRQPNSGF